MTVRSLLVAGCLLAASQALAQSDAFPKGWDGYFVEWLGDNGPVKPTSAAACAHLASIEGEAKFQSEGRMKFNGSKSLYGEMPGDSEHPLNGKIRSLKASGNGFDVVIDNYVYPKAKGHISPIGPVDHPFGLIVTMPHLDHPKTQVITGFYCRSK